MLLALMLAASFIDLDEKTIPTESWSPVFLGLILAASAHEFAPMVAERSSPPAVGEAIASAGAPR
jgi:hypothetical protein